MSSSKLNCIYSRMKTVCLNPKSRDYKNYGGKGVDVCDEWKDSTKVGIHKNVTQGWINFKEWALKNGYEEGLTLRLINRNGNYCPQNCRWENAIGNQLVLTYKGKTQTLIEWCEELNLDYKLVSNRISKRHWSAEKAFETKRCSPPTRLIEYNGKTQSVTEWSKEVGIGIATILNRLDLLHWSVEKTLETKGNPRHHMFTYNGKTQCLKDWCREMGLDYHMVYNRIYKLNWSFEEALEL